jgi:hypothetical protein
MALCDWHDCFCKKNAIMLTWLLLLIMFEHDQMMHVCSHIIMKLHNMMRWCQLHDAMMSAKFAWSHNDIAQCDDVSHIIACGCDTIACGCDINWVSLTQCDHAQAQCGHDSDTCKHICWEKADCTSWPRLGTSANDFLHNAIMCEHNAFMIHTCENTMQSCLLLPSSSHCDSMIVVHWKIIATFSKMCDHVITMWSWMHQTTQSDCAPDTIALCQFVMWDHLIFTEYFTLLLM